MTRTKIEKAIKEFLKKHENEPISVNDVLHYLYGYIDKRVDFHTVLDAVDFVFYQRSKQSTKE